jgi:hypothetical protein
LCADQTGHPNLRVIVDECAEVSQPLRERLEQLLAPACILEWKFLSKDHKSVPDMEILQRLLGADAVLFTRDRVLHNRACDLGFRSYLLQSDGNLRRRKLPGVTTPKQLPASRETALKPDYTHPHVPIASALKQGLTDQNFKRYHTRRRRIRSYFSAESQISSAALTIGASVCEGKAVCGFFLAVAGHSGVKGLRATEGYALVTHGLRTGAWCLLHALRELYLLQLERIPTELFVIPEDAFALCQALLANREAQAPAPASEAVRILLNGLKQVRATPCVKGRFFDAMQAKLNQVVRSNELVRVDFERLATVIPIDQNQKRLLAQSEPCDATKQACPFPNDRVSYGRVPAWRNWQTR